MKISITKFTQGNRWTRTQTEKGHNGLEQGHKQVGTGTKIDSDKDTGRQGHKWTGTQIDRDTGRGQGHRQT